MKHLKSIFQASSLIVLSLVILACSTPKDNYLEVVPNSVYIFSFEKSETVELSKRITDFLDEVAVVMQENEKYYLIINAHSDNTADATTNFQRAIARADNVVAYLKSKGISADRLEIHNMGADEPITNRTDEKSLALNRRLELKLTF
jgi:outer membrane protein OmpA-like peptidoglycan-associated protein